MHTDVMNRSQLLTMIEAARSLSRLEGNHGKKVRLVLEALLRDGLTIVSARTFPLVFAAQVDLTKEACRDSCPSVVHNDGFIDNLMIAVDAVNPEAFTIHIRVAVEQVPQSMRDRQRLLGQIAERLDSIDSRLQVPPSDRRDVLYAEYFRDELDDRQFDAECERLSQVFDALLRDAVPVIEQLHQGGALTVPLRIIELANVLKPSVGHAYKCVRGMTLEYARRELSSSGLSTAGVPSLKDLLSSFPAG